MEVVQWPSGRSMRGKPAPPAPGLWPPTPLAFLSHSVFLGLLVSKPGDKLVSGRPVVQYSSIFFGTSYVIPKPTLRLEIRCRSPRTRSSKFSWSQPSGAFAILAATRLLETATPVTFTIELGASNNHVKSSLITNSNHQNEYLAKRLIYSRVNTWTSRFHSISSV